jgi:SAM-dependent methyltransferase
LHSTSNPTSDPTSASPTGSTVDLTGLDYDFLHYIGRDPAGLRRIQSFYLPFFAGCRQVVDLGCGDGDFVMLLREQSIDAIGVDADDKVAAALQAQGIPFVHQNVFDYLASAPSASVDGIFCAHLVEHLPYTQVLALAQQAYRILRPGGRIVLATPDVRSLYAHLETFYLHFGHVSFYHPRLLCFLFEHAGFSDAQFGANPNTASPLLLPVQSLANQPSPTAPGKDTALLYRREVAPQGRSPLHRFSHLVKRWLARWLVLPFTDSLAAAANDQIMRIDANLVAMAQAIQTLNGPYECYATLRKPSRASDLAAEPAAEKAV